MNKAFKYIIGIFSFLFFLALILTSNASNQDIPGYNESAASDSAKDAKDGSLKYSFDDPAATPYFYNQPSSGLYLKDPVNLEKSTEFDVEKNEYVITEKFGNINYRRPVYMSIDEYQKYQFDRSLSQYWHQKLMSDKGRSGGSLIPGLKIGGDALGGIFGTNTVNIIPKGSAEMIFGVKIQTDENPLISEQNRTLTTFDFDLKIQMNVTGTIGDKVKLGINYDTEATFEFENKFKLEYTGKEDEIIKKIEAGNVTLPLPGTLITGSQNLFGLKTEMQFGNLTVTSVFSQQKGKAQVIEVEGGAQKNSFEINVDEYDANKHFFLSHYFRTQYEDALINLPVINSKINITKVEVWVTNKRGDFDNSRNIIGFLDLGENNRDNIVNNNIVIVNNRDNGIPSNYSNNIYSKLANDPDSTIRDINTIQEGIDEHFLKGSDKMFAGQHYEKIENARRLADNEFYINRKLGYISLNSSLNADEVLAVAFEFTVEGEEEPFQVGEFSSGEIKSPNTLILKLIKGTALTPKMKNWDLMMKNVYALGAYQVKAQDFILNISYRDDQTGNAINYLPEESIEKDKRELIKLLRLDKIDARGEQFPDGRFDYIEGITINSSNGRIFFPMLEPFGDDLDEELINAKVADKRAREKYLFRELYEETQTIASQKADKNKFLIRGSYQSSAGSEIMLNAMNIPQGAVQVTAGGKVLEENIDYIVDYNLGRVKITNQGLLESGTPIKISLESNELFSFQTKTLVGSHFNYKISDDFNVGATIINLNERPLTQKVNLGEEPISNTIWGLNTSYRTETRFLTKMIDKLPLIETKEPSEIAFVGEFAHLIPGHNRNIEIDDQGSVFLDDFEGAKTTLDLKQYSDWVVASTPQGQSDLFPEGEIMGLENGFNRAKISWYNIDQILQRDRINTPSHLKRDNDSRSSVFVHEFFEDDIFPNRENRNNYRSPQPILNVAFYPKEKGVYNYDLDPTNVSLGIDKKGYLNNPETRWGGIMRSLRTTDFEATNIEYIEFWVMDPFAEEEDLSKVSGGNLYFNLGNISEDILRDGRKSYENGLPSDSNAKTLDTTAWGRVPRVQALVDDFANDNAARERQDVGLDGLSDTEEKSFFKSYYDDLSKRIKSSGLPKDSVDLALNDISNDNFHYFKGDDYDAKELGILERYKNYCGHERNSLNTGEGEETNIGKALPDAEDINEDYTLSEGEAYFQYKVELKPGNFTIGNNYLTDSILVPVTLKNKKTTSVVWYQFKIPINDWEDKIGPIEDFKSIRFLRMYMKGFNKPVILRFATLDLVRSDWRKYEFNLYEGREVTTSNEFSNGRLEMSAVNIEENGKRRPVNYILPPGVSRETDPYGTYTVTQLNEQSMVLRVIDLEDGDARAAFKNLYLDMRKYKRLMMEVHAEALDENLLEDDELTAFIRIGTDYTDNYYEYEIPLKLTDHLDPDQLYNQKIVADREKVWPRENQFDIELNKFLEVKQKRNDALRKEGSLITIQTIYQMVDDSSGNWIKVRGNPNLSNVRTIMIGIRNPAQSNRRFGDDDGLEKSAEIWVNELRLSEFDEKGGWAATGRVTTKLADLGNFTVAANKSTPGFGSIEQKIDQRQKETVEGYDLSGNLELGKFFPESWGVSIPVYAGFSENFVNPQYNPLDPDIPMEIALDNAADKEEEKKIKELTRDYTQRKSLNFTNVRLNSNNPQPRLYSISNFSGSYGVNQTLYRDFTTAFQFEKNERYAINYNYNLRPKNVTPLSKSKLFKPKPLTLFRDFNFYYFPSNISFRTDVTRDYYAERLKNINSIEDYTTIEVVDEPNNLAFPNAKPDMTWNRFFDLKYDLTRGIKLDFSSSMKTRVDVLDTMYQINQNEKYYDKIKDSYKPHYDDWKDASRDELLAGNINNESYNHSFNATYTVPVNKLPGLDWTSTSVRYNATYAWTAGPRNLEDEKTGREIELGNTIKNSNTKQINGQLNFLNLYNKVPYLRDVNQKFRQKASGRKPPKKYKTVSFKDENVDLKANRGKNIYHRLKTEDVQVKVTDAKGVAVKGEMEIIDENKIKFTPEKDIDKAVIVVDGKIEDKESVFKIVSDYTFRLAMSARNVSVSFSETNGSLIPGYDRDVDAFAFGRHNSSNFPYWSYVAGGTPDTAEVKRWIRDKNNKWFTDDTLFSDSYTLTNNQTFNARGTLEPIEGLRIDLTSTRNRTNNISELYYFNDLKKDYSFSGYQESGNFSMSTWAILTSFKPYDSTDTYEPYNKFKNDYRIKVYQQLRRDSVLNNDKITDKSIPGYSVNSQDVLIPAFIAAYTGRGLEKNKKFIGNAMPKLLEIFPLPNWRLNYDGLGKISLVKKYTRSVNLSHSYRSTYNIGGYRSNIRYKAGEYVKDSSGYFIPQYEIASVTISEQYSPLVGIDVTWKNNLSTRFEYKRDRTMALSLANNQVSESFGEEYVFGTGYRIEKFQIIVGGTNEYESDINMRFDVSVRDNKTIIRRLLEGEEDFNLGVPQSGQKSISYKFTADYVLSDRFNIRFFIDRVVNIPFTSSSSPTRNNNIGFSLNFNLIQ